MLNDKLFYHPSILLSKLQNIKSKRLSLYSALRLLLAFVRFGGAKLHILFSPNKYFLLFFAKNIFPNSQSSPNLHQLSKNGMAKIHTLFPSAKYFLGFC